MDIVQSNKKKIIIFDGLGLGLPILGRSIKEAFEANNFEVYYLTPKSIKKKILYGLRKGVRRDIHLLRYYNSTKCFMYPKFSKWSFKRCFRQIRPDIVFIIYYIYPYFRGEWLLALKKEIGFKLFTLDVDSIPKLEHYKDVIYFLYQEIPLYDKVFASSKVMFQIMNDLGFHHVEFFHYGAKPISLPISYPKRYDICFVGYPDMRRIFHLEKLKEHHLIVYGRDWRDYKSLVTPALWERIIAENIWDDDLYALLDQSKIILNVNFNRWNSFRSGVNIRIFEALAIGGFLLTDYCDELDDLFEVGLELEAFASPGEMLDKVTYYLKHDEIRQKIAQKGHEKLLKCYTWDHRVKDLIQRMSYENN